MRELDLFIAWVAVAAGISGPAFASVREAAPISPASVFATIGHSEWCSPGTVRLDLRTGRYRVTGPHSWRRCTRPRYSRRVRIAILDADRLAGVRAAYRHALADGLDNPACRNGRHPDEIFFSNGGTPVMRLTDRGRAIAPPDDRVCWSEAARALHRLLDEMFRPPAGRRN